MLRSLRQAAFWLAYVSLASPLEGARVLGVVDPSGTTSSFNHFWASLRCESSAETYLDRVATLTKRLCAQRMGSMW